MRTTHPLGKESKASKRTKLQVAEHLLQRGAQALLTEHDALTALVLAGSAEDILQGLLKRGGRGAEAARQMVAAGAPDMAATLFANTHVTTFTAEGMVKAMRHSFNWVRHADRDDEPLEMEANWDFEAACALLRGAVNHSLLTNAFPFEAADTTDLLWAMADNV